VYFITSKDQFAKVFNMYLSWAETQTTLKLKALHSDRGGEYMAKAVQDTLKQRGIEHHLTMPGSPQSNGKAEWFNHTITDKAMAMLHTAGLSFGFWEYAMNAAVHIYNCSPTRTLKLHTPFEVWYSGKVPDVSHLCVLDARGTCMCPLTSIANWMQRLLKSRLLGLSLVLKATSFGINKPTLSDCQGM
jgi:hypothetical protein